MDHLDAHFCANEGENCKCAVGSNIYYGKPFYNKKRLNTTEDYKT
jgi:hypothetical protein